MTSRTRSIGVSLVILAAITLASCASSRRVKRQRSTAKPPVQQKLLSVQPRVNERSVKAATVLKIFVAASVNDTYSTFGPFRPLEHAHHRETMGNALRHAFRNNFSEVRSISQMEPGLVLVLRRAEMHETCTMRYHAALVFDDKEVVEITGVTSGRSIATTPFGFAEVDRKLRTEAVEKACEAIYDGVFRSEKIGDDFWSSFSNDAEPNVSNTHSGWL